MNAVDKAFLFEHRFRLQTLGDHARFLLTARDPTRPRLENPALCAGTSRIR